MGSGNALIFHSFCGSPIPHPAIDPDQPPPTPRKPSDLSVSGAVSAFGREEKRWSVERDVYMYCTEYILYSIRIVQYTYCTVYVLSSPCIVYVECIVRTVLYPVS